MTEGRNAIRLPVHSLDIGGVHKNHKTNLFPSHIPDTLFYIDSNTGPYIFVVAL